MSSKHRHGLPRKRPINKRHQAIEDEIPALEAAEGVASMPAVDDGPVRVTCEPGDEQGFDVLLTLDVPEMEKQAVAGAVEGPLRNAAQRHGAAMRFRSVVVLFAGEALIGSAIKTLVVEQLAPTKPVKIVVRRGYGDEVVHESEAPSLELSTSTADHTTVVSVGTGDLEPEDLAGLFEPVLAGLASKALDARYELQFAGSAEPDSELEERISATLREAGAIRLVIGARVLFDRELTDRCQVDDRGDEVRVAIDPAADPAITGEAMETVLPDHALGFAGKAVRVEWKRAPSAGEGDHFVRIAASFAPEHIEFSHDGGEAQVVWPPVLELVAGTEPTLRVRPSGRSHTEVLETLPREAADLEAELRGKKVVVDWPKLFVIDEDTERCLADSMAAIAPASVCCTVAGEAREPFLPPPVTLEDESDRCIVRVDTGAGKPPELVRAIERAVPRFANRLAGKVTRVVIGGEIPASRTMLRSLLDLVVGAGPSRLEVEDHGPVDVLLPPMLEFARRGEHGVHLGVDLGGRDEAQQELALQREFEGALPKRAVVTLDQAIETAVLDRLVAALIAQGVESVTRGDGDQLYPEPLPEPEPEPELLPEPEPAPAAELVAEPVAEPPAAAAAPTEGIRVLAQNNEAIPPTLLLGVDAGDDAAHLAAIEQQLAAHLPRFQRRAVMVVLQHNGQDVPVRKPAAMTEMLRRVLPGGAAATLLFRGPDAQGRPHFQVLHSTLRAMPVGANFRDPRS